ncbi:MAG TPA: hypothetical protein VFA52_03085 [Candidatus Paceibacterota bacterium]|nr:hypothetical protein [Candidatus Paceibacterota bacterium]
MKKTEETPAQTIRRLEEEKSALKRQTDSLFPHITRLAVLAADPPPRMSDKERQEEVMRLIEEMEQKYQLASYTGSFIRRLWKYFWWRREWLREIRKHAQRAAQQ